MTDKNVQIFTLSTCGHCKSTKKLLENLSVEFNAIDVDLLEKDQRKATLEDIKKLNPRLSFPTILIDDTVIVGYKEDEIKEALGL